MDIIKASELILKLNLPYKIESVQKISLHINETDKITISFIEDINEYNCFYRFYTGETMVSYGYGILENIGETIKNYKVNTETSVV